MKIFLAHASEDKDLVRDLHSRLRSHGFNPWLDELDIPAGKIWRTAIPQAIRESDIFIACLSQRSVQKQGYIQREFRLALEAYAEKPPETIYLIPLKFDECEIPDLQLPTLSISLRDFQWLDYWKADGFDRLVRSIELEVRKNSVEAKSDKTSSVILKAPDAKSVVLDSRGSSATDINPESECKNEELTTSKQEPQVDTEIIKTPDGKEIDYSTLRDLLKAENWEEANRETQRVMLKVADYQSRKYLHTDALKNFPCPHLQKIDQLWISASKNHFGFSVQAEIWRKYDSLNNYRKQGEKFREEVGWDIYYNVHTLNFDTKSPRGHLPCCDSFCWTWEESLSDRLLRMWHGSGGGGSVYRAGGGIYPNTSRGYNTKSKKVLDYEWQKILFVRVTHCSQQYATFKNNDLSGI